MVVNVSRKKTKGITEFVESDSLQLLLEFRHRIRACCEEARKVNGKPKIVYLWLCVTERGIGHSGPSGANGSGASTLALHEWLTIVDEAASMGSDWLVLTLLTELGRHPDVFRVAEWAQKTHGMTIGFHLGVPTLTDAEIKQLERFDRQKTRIMVRREDLDKMRHLQALGFTVWTANPQEEGGKPDCQGPARMIYVNAKGELYTCGLVDGHPDYRMGHALERPLRAVVADPSVPHYVDESIHTVSPACDGCPSLVANFFRDNL